MRIGGERTSAGLCNRSHGADGRRSAESGRSAEALVRPSTRATFFGGPVGEGAIQEQQWTGGRGLGGW